MATHCYRNRDITGEEIAFIRQLIQDHPELSRWKLSRELCEAWQWKQANGALRDMVCRGLLLMLHRAGEIELPPVKRVVRNRIAERQRPEPVIPDNSPVRGSLANITPLEFVQVRRTPEEALFNSLMEQYHYLGYEQPIGEHLKYLIKARGQVIACLAWQSAPRHLKVRDRQRPRQQEGCWSCKQAQDEEDSAKELDDATYPQLREGRWKRKLGPK